MSFASLSMKKWQGLAFVPSVKSSFWKFRRVFCDICWLYGHSACAVICFIDRPHIIIARRLVGLNILFLLTFRVGRIRLLMNAAFPLLRCPYREVCSHAFRGCSNVEVCSHTFSLLATFSIEMSGRVYNSSIGLQAIMMGPTWKYYSLTSSTTVNWISFFLFKYLKGSSSVGIVAYAQGHRLLDEPAFAWWVPHFLKNRGRIVRKLARRNIFVHVRRWVSRSPKIFDQVYKLDQQNGNSCLLCGDDLYNRRQEI